MTVYLNPGFLQACRQRQGRELTSSNDYQNSRAAAQFVHTSAPLGGHLNG